MSKEILKSAPLSKQKVKLAKELLSDISDEQLLWLSGYLKGLTQKDVFLDNNSFQKEKKRYKTENDIKSKHKNLLEKNQDFVSQIISKTKQHNSKDGSSIYNIMLDVKNTEIKYASGDDIGIYVSNPENFIDKILNILKYDKDATVDLNNKNYKIKDALQNSLQIITINHKTLINYANYAKNEVLDNIILSNKETEKFLQDHNLLDILTLFPLNVSAQEFVDIFERILPLFFPISSSRLLTPNSLEFVADSRNYDLFLKHKQELRFVIKSNDSFHLPKKKNVPIILIGEDLGVSTFRSFLQDRKARKTNAISLLFVGNISRNSNFFFSNDFIELQNTGALTQIDSAFEDDIENKGYVNFKLHEHGAEIFDLIEQGGYIFINGTNKITNNGIRRAIYHIISKHGYFSEEAAGEYFENLIKNQRIVEKTFSKEDI